MKIVCLLGSPRVSGNTDTIVAEILRGINRPDAEVVSHHLHQAVIGYCRGCKSCSVTGNCVIKDDVHTIVEDLLSAQLVIAASPSYWGDVTAQMKTFIDRCTPYGNTNDRRLTGPTGAKGVAVAVRAGPNQKENLNLVHTIGHFFGHLDIPLLSHFTAEGIDTAEDLWKNPSVLAAAFRFGESLSRL